MTVLFMPIVLCFMFLQLRTDKKLLKPFFTLLLLAGLLSAFFWIPALMEKNLIRLSIIPIADRNLYFVKLFQLIVPKWGYGLPIDKDGFSYQLGLPHIILFLCGIFTFVSALLSKKYIKEKVDFPDVFAFFIVTVFFLILLFPQSAFVWKITPFLSEINYPWTLLLPIGFLMSFVAGFVTLQQKPVKYLGFFVAFLAVLFFIPYAKPEKYFDKGDGYYLTNQATTTSSQELMPLWVKELPTKAAESKVESKNGNLTVSNLVNTSKNINFVLTINKDDTIRINTIYYPGWKIFVDDVLTEVSYSNNHGVMEFPVKKGVHKVNAVFGETPIRLIADFISMFGVLFLMIMLFPGFKKYIL